ncbi:MAG: pyridine nucleotide-disulfide oxidoreductase [Candidatus Colwellbacteria bacterium CG10_big_fil_rev_8_21_14_0_10_41_28]|uniref:Pyridine nucleotide-disulfide oxidoreductase n=1 Tax=Candidatus Colwellbacteria bacterium CG10_big_fil_rev_8_21_14_0_10_41_28 TaxID=1974539 RepID=A0A2H0VHI2_9BACT|nr:MAG: pyridine nucleotide-disulfide oxidoreductase [Candidatus Colwellbacteria bacterium CG10_big_fil_rev_8_21_14_0_10_41_28]
MYQLIIIGGGPAGVSAGVYAARKKMKTLLIAEEFGGQSSVSDDIENWIGVQNVSGYDLSKMMEDHLRKYEGDIDIKDGEKVLRVEKIKENHYKVITAGGEEFETERILLTAGSHRRRVDVPGGEEFDGKGVAYCATCDAPLFKGKETAVIGGGNSGLEAVIDLLEYASKIYLLHRRDTLKGDPATQEKIKASDKVEIIYNAEIKEIFGDKFVKGLKYVDIPSGEEKTLDVEGIFVEIGSIPNSHLVEGLVDINNWKKVVVNHKTQRTSDPGIWAAGDVSDVYYNQNNVSAGDGIKAVLNIHDDITGQKRE